MPCVSKVDTSFRGPLRRAVSVLATSRCGETSRDGFSSTFSADEHLTDVGQKASRMMVQSRQIDMAVVDDDVGQEVVVELKVMDTGSAELNFLFLCDIIYEDLKWV